MRNQLGENSLRRRRDKCIAVRGCNGRRAIRASLYRSMHLPVMLAFRRLHHAMMRAVTAAARRKAFFPLQLRKEGQAQESQQRDGKNFPQRSY